MDKNSTCFNCYCHEYCTKEKLCVDHRGDGSGGWCDYWNSNRKDAACEYCIKASSCPIYQRDLVKFCEEEAKSPLKPPTVPYRAS